MLWVVRGDGRRSWGILAGRFRRPIDPHGRGQRFWTWWPLYEPLRMGGVRRQARAVPDREDRRGAAVVHGGWCQIAQAAVMVRVVVPREQIAADVARVCERAEPARKLPAGTSRSGTALRRTDCRCSRGAANDWR